MSTLITQAFRPLSARARRDSGSSFNSEDSSQKQDPLIRTAVPILRGGADNVLQRPVSFNLPRPRPHRSRSTEAIEFIKEGRQGAFRPVSEALDSGWKPFIDARPSPNSSDIHNFLTASSSSTPAASADEHLVESTVRKDPAPTPLPTRWRFFPFRRDTSQTVTQDNVMPQHTRGDVVCLSYNTLDDRGMRRLEGRSDHRPVIGSYAVYL